MNAFYDALFAPLVERLGPIDRDTLMPIIGFDAGGPIALCTIGRERGDQFITYITCELAVRAAQRPSPLVGRYELLMSCDDEAFARRILTRIGAMSLSVAFDEGHTIDIGPVEPDSPVQAVGFEAFSASFIDGKPYGVMRLHGLSRLELEEARDAGLAAILLRRKERGVPPQVSVRGE